MKDEVKIETESKSFRLPIDVVELLQKWGDEAGKNPTHALITCVREAAKDRERLQDKSADSARQSENVLQGGDGLVLQIPESRDELADRITELIQSCTEMVGLNDRISALGVARARIYKGTPEYQAGNRMRLEKGLGPSIYDDEKKLAEQLSAGGGAGVNLGVREKGDTTR
jgi:hypothetical protein